MRLCSLSLIKLDTSTLTEQAYPKHWTAQAYFTKTTLLTELHLKVSLTQHNSRPGVVRLSRMFGRDEDRDRSKRSKRSKRSRRSSEPSSSPQPGSSSSRASAAEPQSPRRGQASAARKQVWVPSNDPRYPDELVPLYPDLVTEEEKQAMKELKRKEQQQREDHHRMWKERALQTDQLLRRQRDEAIQRQNAAREKARAEQEQRQRYEAMVRSTQAASLSPPVARTPVPRAASTANQSPAAAPSHDPYRRELERMMRQPDEALGNRSSQRSTEPSSFFLPADAGGQASGPLQQPRRNADPRAHHNADPAQQYYYGYNDAWPRGARPMHLGLLGDEEWVEYHEHRRLQNTSTTDSGEPERQRAAEARRERPRQRSDLSRRRQDAGTAQRQRTEEHQNEERARRQRAEQQLMAIAYAKAADNNPPPPVATHRHGLPQGTFARTVPGAGFNVQPDRPLAPPVARQYAPPAHAQAGSGQALYPNQPVSPRRQPYSGYLQPGQTFYPNAPFVPQQQLSSGPAQPAQPAQPMSPSSGSSVPTTPQDQRVPGGGTPFRGYRRRDHRPSGTPQFGVIGPNDPFLELTYGEATYDPRSGQGSSSDDDDR